MSLAHELGVALVLATGRAWRVADRPLAERVPGLAWLPLVGALVGGVAALVAGMATAVVSGSAGALGAVVVLQVARARETTWVVSGAVAILELLALVILAPAARAVALVVAPMLACWATVVQCHGGVARSDARGIATLAGRARFREFAIASVSALGTTLVLLDAVGLVVAVAAALVTLGVRAVAYRRGRAIGDGAMSTTSALVETGVLALLASMGWVLGPG